MPNAIKCSILAGDARFYYETKDGNALNEIDIGTEEWPYKWGKKNLTWKLLNHTQDITKKIHIEKAVTVALRAIGLHIDLKFSRQRDTTKQADITIEFTSDLEIFDNRQSVLAHAYLFSPGSSKNGIIQFNDNHNFSVYGGSINAHIWDPVHYPEKTTVELKLEPLLHILLHELIHSLGLRHDTVDRDAIMWPFAKQGQIFNYQTKKFEVNPNAFILHQRDIQRLQQKYGKRLLSLGIIQRDRERRLHKFDFD